MTKKKSAVTSNLPVLDDTERAWDSGAAIKRVRDFASGEDNTVDFSKYRKAFLWVSPDEEDKQGGYKLPFADVVDGELKAVWRGVAAAMAALMGARGGVSIPDADKQAVHTQISKYYKKFDKEPPKMESIEDSSKDVEEGRGEEDESEEEHDNTETERRYVKAFYDTKAKIAVASTDVEDRHGETIDQTGWDLKNFKNNDVMLWAHNHEKISVGNCRNCRIDKSEGKPRLIFEPDFHDVTEDARALKILYEQGRLKTFSVGFLPTEFDGNRYTKQELLEISAVNVPANPDAMMLAYKSLKKAGIKKDTAREVLGMQDLPLPKSKLFKSTKGAIQDEMDVEDMQMQKMDNLKVVHEIYWAFCDVYHDEETAVGDFDKLLKELIGLLGNVADGSYQSPMDNKDPVEPMPESKVLDSVLTMRKDIDKINNIVENLVKAQANKETSAAPKPTKKTVKVDRARQSLTKVIAKVSDDIFEAEKQGQKKADRVELLKVVKRAAEILSISQK